MSTINYIRNIIYLYKVLHSKKISKDSDFENLFRVMRNFYKNKNSLIRNLACAVVKRCRKEYPYQVNGYKEAKEIFFSQEDFKLKTGMFLVFYKNKYAVKGKRYDDYYINSVWSYVKFGSVLKLSKNNELFDYTGYSSYYIDDNKPCFRPATKEEIEQFKTLEKKHKDKQKRIKELEKQIEKIKNENIESI